MVQLGIFKFSALFYFSALLILPRNTQVTCYVSTTVNRLHKYVYQENAQRPLRAFRVERCSTAI